VLGRFDDVGDLAVRVGVTDAVSACVLPGDFCKEDGGVGAECGELLEPMREMSSPSTVTIPPVAW
jgi:hypothetical protein